MESFYIYLPSNSSADIYPDNTLSTYSTALRRPLQLRGDWEVGLAEISHPSLWTNIGPNFSRFSVESPAGGWREVGVPEGYYTRHRLLLERINAAGRQVDGRLGTFAHYNANMRKVLISLEGKSAISLHHGLALVLGFDEARTLQGPGQFTPSRGIDLNHGVHAMYVYCDLVEHQIVGDTEVPLLRTVPFATYSDARRPAETNITFNPIHYVPVAKSFVDTIVININDDVGTPIPFVTGKVIVKLHLRQRRPEFV